MTESTLPHPLAAITATILSEPGSAASRDSPIIDRMAVRASSPILVGRATELDRSQDPMVQGTVRRKLEAAGGGTQKPAGGGEKYRRESP